MLNFYHISYTTTFYITKLKEKKLKIKIKQYALTKKSRALLDFTGLQYLSLITILNLNYWLAISSSRMFGITKQQNFYSFIVSKWQCDLGFFSLSRVHCFDGSFWSQIRSGCFFLSGNNG